MLREGVVQGFQPRASATQIPILAAVGPLQFEVFKFRLESEYGAEVDLGSTEWKFARWVHPSVDRSTLTPGILPTGAILADDAQGADGDPVSGRLGAVGLYTETSTSIVLAELPFDEESVS